MQQVLNGDGNEGHSIGDRRASAQDRQRAITSLTAALNGMPDPTRGGGLTPNDIGITAVRPNPFNGATTVDYFLPDAADVSLQVYDSNGRLVTDLIRGQWAAGRHSAVWNAAGMPSGTYLIKLSGGGGVTAAKTVLVR